jgi:hypothetical protein
MPRTWSALLAIAVVVTLLPNRSEAGPILYTDREAFIAAASPDLLVTMDSFVGTYYGARDGRNFCNNICYGTWTASSGDLDRS